jgi:hypothetical protein
MHLSVPSPPTNSYHFGAKHANICTECVCYDVYGPIRRSTVPVGYPGAITPLVYPPRSRNRVRWCDSPPFCNRTKPVLVWDAARNRCKILGPLWDSAQDRSVPKRFIAERPKNLFQVFFLQRSRHGQCRTPKTLRSFACEHDFCRCSGHVRCSNRPMVPPDQLRSAEQHRDTMLLTSTTASLETRTQN